MKLISYVVLGLFLSFSSVVNASQLPFITINHESSSVDNDLDEKYFSISEVVVSEVVIIDEIAPISSNKGLGDIISTGGKLIAFGKKIWKIVEAGKPVTNVNIADRVSVLPKTDNPRSAFYEMTNWQEPRVKKYKVEYKNFYGVTVVSFIYSVRFDYGGKYQDHGHYLTGVGVDADSVIVSWGFEFNATNSVTSITNRGTVLDPIASVSFQINYEAKSILRTIKATESFYVTGKGQLKKM